jgi:DNA-binding CsgD family transcriptional regulator
MVTIKVEITKDEKNFVQLLSNGYTVASLARHLSVNRKTLNAKFMNLKKKVQARNTYELVAIFLRNKLIE